ILSPSPSAMQAPNIDAGCGKPHQYWLRAKVTASPPRSFHPGESGNGAQRLFHGVERPVDVGVRVREGEVELRVREREDAPPEAFECEPGALPPIGGSERAVAGELGAGIDEEDLSDGAVRQHLDGNAQMLGAARDSSPESLADCVEALVDTRPFELSERGD